MEISKFCHVEIKRLLFIISTLVSLVVVFQFSSLPFGNIFSSLFTTENLIHTSSSNSNTTTITDQLNSESIYKHHVVDNNTNLINSNKESVNGNNASSDQGRSIDLRYSPPQQIITPSDDSNEESKSNHVQDQDGIRSNTITRNYIKKKRGGEMTSLAQMNSLWTQNLDSSKSMKWRFSQCDREILSAKLQIKNAPIVRNSKELYASLYQNVSMFIRSYELMERLLKVYIYSEGEKPIFHDPKMSGIYASEGWFMKIMEGNKQFVIKDPRKAHLFYLPVSSQRLRNSLLERGKNSPSWQSLQLHLDNYVDLIASKYRFWNRTGGADHFLVACHDWAPRITRSRTKNCIRVLCNSNGGANRDFKIGKDTSLPVTLIKGGNPLRDLGGKPASERRTLAFFAGNMHGYLRPVLLQYWENKIPDMKIFGPINTTMYKEYMKNSKYCICAKGYEVHTPRVVEAILYECVPVIIADNYVPPFFEVLDWESFAVFVKEEDVPELRNILVGISEEKYLEMQARVKMVQQHFLWHKKAVKYDLFHMILHSVWYNRVFQM